MMMNTKNLFLNILTFLKKNNKKQMCQMYLLKSLLCMIPVDI